MALSILLVPILAGYWFLIQTRLFQPRISRLTGYHVFFHAGITGILLLTFAWLLSLSLNSISFVQDWLTENSQFEYFDLIVLSGVLALCLPPLVNLSTGWLITQISWNKKQARKYGNLINLVIFEAWEARFFVEITTTGGKSYIGYPVRSDIRTVDEADVSLVPFLSGYRDPRNKKLVITTKYWPIIEKCLSEDGELAHLKPEHFKVVLPRREIASARGFDLSAYEEFKKEQ